ncbi:hypothetical protein [Pontibacter amylolyticus]|uniref:Uncharacterized protein n=1 Tax=Pontibacter amylolyticus TaxID=1424080 RepID=A0ABQ1W9Y4_9BACT|nr:hypothetical protein [Pontibacter amylolyticus]GGG21045.1 hypothetical protein GCM10011323_26250 [Pontibacter amylolyticus]
MTEIDKEWFEGKSQTASLLLLEMASLIGIQFILLLISGIAFGLGPESTMKGWIEAFTISLLLAVVLYHFYIFKNQYFKVLLFSILSIALLGSQIYIYVEILKWDIGFGFMIIILTGVFAPLNYRLIKYVLSGKQSK